MREKKIRVGHVSMYYSPVGGGQGVYINTLINILSKYKIDSIVLQPQRPGSVKANNIIFSPHIPKGHYLSLFLFKWDWFIFNLSLLFCKKILKQQDIIISNYPFHYPSFKWHKKVIILSHGVLWRIPQRHFFDKYHKKIALKAKKENVFMVANDSHFLKELGYNLNSSIENYLFKKITNNTWYIPNCVDTTLYVKNPRIKKQKIILVPRNISKERGIDLAILAFSFLEKKYPEYILKIAGGPTDQIYFRECQNLISKLGLTNKVIFTGSIKWENMVDVYNEAELTVIPSIEKEGTSLSALESMSCGTAVVSTNVGGLEDLPCVKSEPNSIMLADAIEKVLNKIEYYSSTQAEKVHKIYNLQNWEKAWMDVICSLYKRD